jgi:hypothetical protein
MTTTKQATHVWHRCNFFPNIFDSQLLESVNSETREYGDGGLTIYIFNCFTT